MSYRPEKLKGYAGAAQSRAGFATDKTEDELRFLFRDILQKGVHGFCFSLYEEGQKPGDIISEDQIRRRMNILKPHTQWIRSFSCTDGNEHIPKVAKESGLQTLVGAWLGNDKEKNAVEIENLVRLAKEGLVDVAAVGNEVLYRNDLSETELLEYIAEVKKQLPDIPVGYVDAYYEFVNHPVLVENCDIILCNCYPYWEGTKFEYSLEHMKHMYELAKNAGKGKRIMITETGWPSEGEGLKDALPSHLNALKYFINAQIWANDEQIDMFYFSSFDESWKVGAEGDVGAYWGIWDKNGKLKF
jgi:exo-beta-1,3-glucanase (GH17 family)